MSTKFDVYVFLFFFWLGYIESNTGKSASQGNLRRKSASQGNLRRKSASQGNLRRKSARQGNLWHLRCRRFPCLALFASVWFYFSLLSAVFSLLFDSYVLLADDHVNNGSYFPFMSIKKVVPYFCVLSESYYVVIWLIVRICVFIKDWKLIYSELFILKRKSMENWGGGSWHKYKLYSMHLPVKRTWFICLALVQGKKI